MASQSLSVDSLQFSPNCHSQLYFLCMVCLHVKIRHSIVRACSPSLITTAHIPCHYRLFSTPYFFLGFLPRLHAFVYDHLTCLGWATSGIKPVQFSCSAVWQNTSIQRLAASWRRLDSLILCDHLWSEVMLLFSILISAQFNKLSFFCIRYIYIYVIFSHKLMSLQTKLSYHHFVCMLGSH